MNGEHVITFTAGKSFLQIKTSFTQKSHHTHLWYSKEYQEGRRIVCGLWRSLLQCLRSLSLILFPTNVAFLTFCTIIFKFMFFSHNILQELAPWMINLNISHATKDALLYEQNDIHTIHNVSKNWHSLIKLIMWIYQTKSTPYQQSAKKTTPLNHHHIFLNTTSIEKGSPPCQQSALTYKNICMWTEGALSCKGMIPPQLTEFQNTWKIWTSPVLLLKWTLSSMLQINMIRIEVPVRWNNHNLW